MPMQRHLWLGALWLAAAQAPAQPLRPREDATAEIAQQAIAAYRKGDIPAAIVLATKLTEAAPKQPQGWFLRAQLHVTQREHAKAVADYTEVIKLDPKSANAVQARGEAYFKLGKIAESIAESMGIDARVCQAAVTRLREAAEALGPGVDHSRGYTYWEHGNSVE